MSEPIERILLALDTIHETRTAIDLAVRLAGYSKLRLHVVFVEDEDLLNLASLPVAREVAPGVGSSSVASEQVELHLRAAATRAQQEIMAAAQKHAIEYSFEVMRGSAETVLAVASERDLIVAGALARPVAGHLRTASRWLAVLALAPGPMLLACDDRDKRPGAVVLLHERSAGQAQLLQTAARIAELGGGNLTVMCPSMLAAAGDFADWVDEQIAPANVRAQIEAAAGEPTALQARIAELDCGLLACAAIAIDRGELTEVMRRLTCHVLVAS
jgi:nucleotide-binding universal stress UspA family protein